MPVRRRNAAPRSAVTRMPVPSVSNETLCSRRSGVGVPARRSTLTTGWNAASGSTNQRAAGRPARAATLRDSPASSTALRAAYSNSGATTRWAARRFKAFPAALFWLRSRPMATPMAAPSNAVLVVFASLNIAAPSSMRGLLPRVAATMAASFCAAWAPTAANTVLRAPNWSLMIRWREAQTMRPKVVS